MLFLLAVNPVLTAIGKEPTILVFGDSVSAAYGMDPEQGWVHLLSEQLKTGTQPSMPSYLVINASVSGETTGGGLVRLPKTLEIHQPDILVLELGGNDGLRGYPIDKIDSNLRAMTAMALTSGAKVLLIGMVLPPNYGRRYTEAFESVFRQVAAEFDIQFLPFFLQGVATPESLIQGDGIHPRAEAQAMLLEDVWPYLEKLL
ncbi:MAG TPA: arylesterase [Gammaproteobacteria bacterium]|nr:arylesterase [Gammaproteobacteria bacterium]HIL96063.1 arylesterase [Pseudomonadales bacterium]